MPLERQFEVVNLPELNWPSWLEVPGRFRLFVAADIENISDTDVQEFVAEALKRGAVYFCIWGADCERFHDIVDESVVKAELGNASTVRATPGDTIMTTWHTEDTLEQALDFFVACAVPTEGLIFNSSFRLVLCLDNADWADRTRRVLQSTRFFI